MIIYSDTNGTRACGGIEDIQKSCGVDFSYAQMVVHDESGALTGFQGGNVSLERGTQLIKSLRSGELMIKAQHAAMRKSVSGNRTLKKSFDNNNNFALLASELEHLRDTMFA